MKFAILAVVMAVVSSSALGYQGYNRPGRYQQGGYQQNNLMSLMSNMMRNSQGQNFDMSNFAANIDPAIVIEAQNLLLKTIQRTEELIDNMPSTAETARQMADLWGIAYPQLRTLLSKAG